MGTITPILDTLLPQVLGRAGDVARVGARAASAPISALRPISGEMPLPSRSRLPPGPGRESSAGSVRGPTATGARAGAAETEASSARDLARAISVGSAASGERSTALHLSRGGGALARLLAEVAAAREPSAVAASRPLATASQAPQPSALAPLLAQQISASGLFYESHLAAWVRGQLPRAQVADESRARLGTASDRRGAGNASGRDSAASSGANAATGSGAAPIDPRLATLVRQQIELLASGVFQWQGEAWTGTPMRWTVEHDQDGAGNDNDSSASATTALSLQLPGIGAFEARLRVSGKRVSVAAWAEPGAGQKLVAADLETLRRRLRDAGFDASSVRLVTEPAV